MTRLTLALFLALLVAGCADEEAVVEAAESATAPAPQVLPSAPVAEATEPTEEQQTSIEDSVAAREPPDQPADPLEPTARLPDTEPLVEEPPVVGEESASTEVDEDLARLEKKRNGLKVRAYRGVRTVAVKGLFGGLALAARKADGIDVSQLPEPVRKAADLGVRLVRQHAGDGLDPASVDWGAVAERLTALGEQPPARVSMTLASALATIGQSRLALEEVILLDPEALSTGKERVAHDVLAGVLYRMEGYSALAELHLQAAAHPEEGHGVELTPKMQAGLHALIATNSLARLDLATFDVEMTYLARSWPDNPITVFLTGERHAADGEPEKAAHSLEAWAESVGDEWLAKRVAERARELRDGTGKRGMLVEDPEFLARMTHHYISEAADESEVARLLADLLSSAGELGNRLVDKLPGARRGDDR